MTHLLKLYRPNLFDMLSFSASRHSLDNFAAKVAYEIADYINDQLPSRIWDFGTVREILSGWEVADQLTPREDFSSLTVITNCRYGIGVLEM